MPASSRTASPCPHSSDDSGDDNAGDSLAPPAPCESWSRGSLKAGEQGACFWGQGVAGSNRVVLTNARPADTGIKTTSPGIRFSFCVAGLP